jgi:predicted DNA-binding transcriptional regulator YafY
LYQAAACGALAKLENLLPDEQRREVAWARTTLLAVGMNWADPGQTAPYLKALRNAIRERRRVRMRYRGQQQCEPMQRDFGPFALAHSWGWQYCVGYCHLRRAIRSFRLDRICDLVVLDQTFVGAADFDLQAYLTTDPWFQRTVRARLRFGPESALIALDQRAYWESCEEQPGGDVLVSFSAPDLETAASIVLRYGFPATIVEPTALRDVVRARASALAARYATAE